MRKYSLRRNQDMTLMRIGRTQAQTDNPNQPNPVQSVFGAEAEKKNHKKETWEYENHCVEKGKFKLSVAAHVTVLKSQEINWSVLCCVTWCVSRDLCDFRQMDRGHTHWAFLPLADDFRESGIHYHQALISIRKTKTLKLQTNSVAMTKMHVCLCVCAHLLQLLRQPSWPSLAWFWLHPDPSVWPAAAFFLSGHKSQNNRTQFIASHTNSVTWPCD